MAIKNLFLDILFHRWLFYRVVVALLEWIFDKEQRGTSEIYNLEKLEKGTGASRIDMKRLTKGSATSHSVTGLLDNFPGE